MNLHFLLLLSATVLLISCKTQQYSTVRNVPDRSAAFFSVQVFQDGKLIKPKKGVVTLQKAPFKFEVTLSKTDHVYVSASKGTYYYDYPLTKNIFECEDQIYLKDCRFVAIKTGSEAKFNPKKELLLGNEDYQFVWFYDEEMDWHRFDPGVKVEEGVVYGTRTVENIFDCDVRDKNRKDLSLQAPYDYPVENISHDIYMVFATSHYQPEKTTELQRERFILRFE